MAAEKRESVPSTQSERDAARQRERHTQSERFIAKARELGLDEREETFDAALTKVARHKSVDPSGASDRANDELEGR